MSRAKPGPASPLALGSPLGAPDVVVFAADKRLDLIHCERHGHGTDLASHILGTSDQSPRSVSCYGTLAVGPSPVSQSRPCRQAISTSNLDIINCPDILNDVAPRAH